MELRTVVADLLAEGHCLISDHTMRWLGIARRALDMTCAYAAKRELAPGKPLASRQAIQHMIADSRVELEAAKEEALAEMASPDLDNDRRIELARIGESHEKRIRELAPEVGAFVVPEINYGQMVLEVERCAAGKCPSIGVPHGGGGVHDPEKIRLLFGLRVLVAHLLEDSSDSLGIR